MYFRVPWGQNYVLFTVNCHVNCCLVNIKYPIYEHSKAERESKIHISFTFFLSQNTIKIFKPAWNTNFRMIWALSNIKHTWTGRDCLIFSHSSFVLLGITSQTDYLYPSLHLRPWVHKLLSTKGKFCLLLKTAVFRDQGQRALAPFLYTWKCLIHSLQWVFDDTLLRQTVFLWAEGFFYAQMNKT